MLLTLFSDKISEFQVLNGRRWNLLSGLTWLMLYLLAVKMTVVDYGLVLNQDQRDPHEQSDHWREEDATVVYVC